MKVFGFEITRVKAPAPPVATVPPWNSGLGMGTPFWNSSAFPFVHEPFTGAWQRNQGLYVNSVLVYHAIYRCITLISQDISKMRIRLMEQDEEQAGRY